jgi:hypothetical protein
MVWVAANKDNVTQLGRINKALASGFRGLLCHQATEPPDYKAKSQKVRTPIEMSDWLIAIMVV